MTRKNLPIKNSREANVDSPFENIVLARGLMDYFRGVKKRYILREKPDYVLLMIMGDGGEITLSKQKKAVCYNKQKEFECEDAKRKPDQARNLHNFLEDARDTVAEIDMKRDEGDKTQSPYLRLQSFVDVTETMEYVVICIESDGCHKGGCCSLEVVSAVFKSECAINRKCLKKNGGKCYQLKIEDMVHVKKIFDENPKDKFYL